MTTHMLLVSDGSLPLVHAEFRYRCVDPFAVQLRLSLGRFQAVSWIFSRELLIAGIRRPSGIGDVRIYPGGDGVLIELRSAIDPHALLLGAKRVAAQAGRRQGQHHLPQRPARHRPFPGSQKNTRRNSALPPPPPERSR